MDLSSIDKFSDILLGKRIQILVSSIRNVHLMHQLLSPYEQALRAPPRRLWAGGKVVQASGILGLRPIIPVGYSSYKKKIHKFF